MRQTDATGQPITAYRRQKAAYADESFRPTDFVVQGNRLFRGPYRLFSFPLRGDCGNASEPAGDDSHANAEPEANPLPTRESKNLLAHDFLLSGFTN